MKPRAYIETTVVSYLTAWPSRDVVIAGYQQTTREWWQDAADRFELVASELVINEASAGDADAAQDRLAALESVTLLDATEESAELAQQLIDAGAIPEKAAEDAGHIAIAVTNGVDYMVTWNLYGNMELSAYRQCHNAITDRTRLPQRRLRTDNYLHTRRTHGT